MTTDFNGRQIISKGTLVRVTTSNGGDITMPLAANHYPTYDIVFAGNFIIPAHRITSVTII